MCGHFGYKIWVSIDPFLLGGEVVGDGSCVGLVCGLRLPLLPPWHPCVPSIRWTMQCGMPFTTGSMPEDLRALAGLPPSLVAASVGEARLPDGNRLTLIQASQVGLIYRAARRALFIQGGGDVNQWVDPNPWESQGPTSSATSLPAPSTTPNEVKMKFTHILDQSDDSEFQIVTDIVKAKWMQKYIDVTGGLPCEETEPTKEQLSALHRRVHQLASPPYADFSVFTPFGKKMYRSTRYRTYIPNLDGTFVMREVPGPTNYTQWLACNRVWKVAMVMLDCIPIAVLQQYEIHISRSW